VKNRSEDFIAMLSCIYFAPKPAFQALLLNEIKILIKFELRWKPLFLQFLPLSQMSRAPLYTTTQNEWL